MYTNYRPIQMGSGSFYLVIKKKFKYWLASKARRRPSDAIELN